MSRHKSVLAVLFVCSFRLFTAFLINDERELNDTSFNLVHEYRDGTRKSLVSSGDLPQNFDWRDHNGVTPVKDQDQCSACWAFSSVAAIESQLKIQHRQDIILSEQFLIDCNNMNAGCTSASLLKTYGDVVVELTGVLRVGDYPAFNQEKQNCMWTGDISRLVPVTGFRRVAPNNEVDMVTYLYNNGPLSAGINDATMVHYTYNPDNFIDRPTPQSCPNTGDSLNHAVLVVGYGVWTDSDGTQIPYWIIKNSWGWDFGDRGFYYLERGINACGIANDVIFPFVA